MVSRKQRKAEERKLIATAQTIVDKHHLMTDEDRVTYEFNGRFWEVIKDEKIETYSFINKKDLQTLEQVLLMVDLLRLVEQTLLLVTVPVQH